MNGQPNPNALKKLSDSARFSENDYKLVAQRISSLVRKGKNPSSDSLVSPYLLK